MQLSAVRGIQPQVGKKNERFNHRAIVFSSVRPLYWGHTGNANAAAAARGKEGSVTMKAITYRLRRETRGLRNRETALDALTRALGAERPPLAFPILGAFR